MGQALILRRGGGSSGLPIDIVGGTTQPAGAENLIWLNTSTPIGQVTVDDTAPASPTAGDVYIEIDPASSAVVQLGNGSRIVMLPLGIAYQYQSDAWVSIDAYAYLSGSWVTFSTDIPDGDTTTPVNDTNTWLRCAGISPSAEGNPTLAQVVANQSLCTTLMNSQNAVNYMIRSTTLLTAVLGSTTAIAALDASTPFVSPSDMQSAAVNGFELTCSSQAYGEVYKITNTVSGFWAAVTSVGQWACMKMPKPVWIYKFSLMWANNCYPSDTRVTWKLEASNDGTNWTDLLTSIVTGEGSYATAGLNLAVNATSQYQYFRVKNTALATSGTPSIYANKFKIYGKTMEV